MRGVPSQVPFGEPPEGRGRDKAICQEYLHGVVEPYAKGEYGLASTYACGLCQVGVPCEKGVPVRPSGGVRPGTL